MKRGIPRVRVKTANPMFSGGLPQPVFRVPFSGMKPTEKQLQPG
jgi:hypothetical protein